MQTFINRCLRYILRIWWPNISNKHLWGVTGQEYRWTGHTLRTEDGEIPKPPYYGTLNEAGREEDIRLDGEDRSSEKGAEVERAHRHSVFLKELWTLLLCTIYQQIYYSDNLLTLYRRSADRFI
jgi:hypothetical protein